MNRPLFFLFFFLGILGTIGYFRSSPKQSSSHAFEVAPEMAALAPIDLPKARDEAMIHSSFESEPSVNVAQIADNFLREHRDEWQIQSYHELRPDVLAQGTQVKYAVYQNGIPIEGMEITLNLSKDHKIESVTNGYHPVARVEVDESAVMPAEEIAAQLSDRYNVQAITFSQAQKVFFYQPDIEEVELAYKLPLVPRENSGSPVVEAMIRVSDGEILKMTAPPGFGPSPPSPHP
jgi:Zn-dependent metalloprotease